MTSAPSEPARAAAIGVELEVDPCLSLATQQNGIPLIKTLVLEQRGDVELRDLLVRVRAEPEFATDLELRLASLAPGARHRWTAPDLALSPAFLAGVRERWSGAALSVEVTAGAIPVATARREVSVLPYDQWGGLRTLPELLCAFVLPNHPAVGEWLRRAAALLEQWTGDPSLSAYSTGRRERVLATAAAVYGALQDAGLAYVVPPASFELEGQKVRTPDRIAEEKLATCLDLALATAACLEQAGLHALVAIVDGHAFAGVWLEESTFLEPSIEDSALLQKRVELGEIAVFDPTAATSRPPLGFDAAVELARKHLDEPSSFRCAIDLRRSRMGGIRPLPLRADGIRLETDRVETTGAAPGPAPTLELPRRPSEDVEETPAGRVERWKRRLLDLSNRNRLLNFLATKKTIALECRDLGGLEDVLAAGRVLTLRPALPEQRAASGGTRPVTDATLAALLAAELESGRVATRHDGPDLEARLTEIFRAAREGLEEGGASGLYVALGFLEWHEGATSGRPRLAPLILVPVDLQRGSIRQGFRLTRAADEPRFNSTLVEMLGARHDLRIAGIEPLPEDASGVDVALVLQQVRAALRDVPRWRVLEEAKLGFFTFAKHLIWKDLDSQADVLLDNRIVSHLVHRPEREFDPLWREPDSARLDDEHATADLHCPLPADSSQLAAVVAAAEGNSFVLEGPPGTGKSQTIANLIAHALALGKTVLFVSEKTAALDVVFRRLEAIGLARFCLELHSNKARKSEVVRRLGESLHGARERTPEEWQALARELDRVRAELNAYARAVGRVHPNGLSVFRATSLLTELRDVDACDLGWSDAAELDRERLESARSALADAENALRSIGAPHEHPLAGVGIEDVPAGTAERLREAFAGLRKVLDATSAAERAAALVSIDLGSADLRDVNLLVAGCRAVLGAPASGFRLIARGEADAEESVLDACRAGRERDAARDELLASFDPGFLDLDLPGLRGRIREASSSWLLARWWKTRALRKGLLGVHRHDRAPSLEDLRASVETALSLKELETRVAAALEKVSGLTGTPWRAEDSRWESLEELLAWARGARASVLESARDPRHGQALLERLAAAVESSGGADALRPACADAVEALESAVATAGSVAGLLRLEGGDAWNDARAPRRLASWRERIDLVEPALPRLKPWALWRRMRSKVVGLSLSALVAKLERGGVRPDQLVRAFERSYYELWLDHARGADPALRDFLSLTHEQRIRRFRELDERCLGVTRKVIAAKLAARVPAASSDAVPGSELGELKRQLLLQRRHLAPRQLFQRTRTLVQKLKPCFLMSPISVAQYLPPGGLAFDIVVFDEASQIPTWDAVGAIARGKQVVVVGDSKQLPPTSFFDAIVEDGDPEPKVAEGLDEDGHGVAELESILDECRAANVPPLDLRWHYRSRHESLIAFSNRRYYDNRLHTFPAAAFAGLGVQWRHVADGVYDKGRSRTNRREAEALVGEVLRRLRDPELARSSIGIVTFSAAQQLAVEDLLDAERRADPSLDRFFVAAADRPEPVFVKNLENVQGDERDAILFSIGYGPDERGRVAMSFGPLNLQGGERRLNVAVTRARRELVVFSTLTADQIDLARTRARGVADLKAFLSYAQHGLRVLPAEGSPREPADPFDSPLEKEIAAALRQRGHEVHLQVGCSGYRVDLAVVDPDRPGRYLLGIEGDGANYHTAETARDRDRLRQSVLEGLGWTLIRVWSGDWWEAKDEQVERLLAAIESAKLAARDAESKAAPTVPMQPPAEVEVEPAGESDAEDALDRATASAEDGSEDPGTDPGSSPASERTPGQARTEPALPPTTPRTKPREVHVDGAPSDAVLLPIYRARPARSAGAPDDFFSAGEERSVAAELEAIVDFEGPIRLELAAARVAACFGIERTRAAVVDRVDGLVRRIGLPCTEQGGRKVLWPRSIEPRTWRAFRASTAPDADLREPADLPVQEIANAAAHVLALNGACPRRDLQRAVARLFGFKALGSTIAAHLDEGIDHLIADGRARLDENGRVERIEAN